MHRKNKKQLKEAPAWSQENWYVECPHCEKLIDFGECTGMGSMEYECDHCNQVFFLVEES